MINMSLECNNTKMDLKVTMIRQPKSIFIPEVS
jgi:hypothetical protein